MENRRRGQGIIWLAGLGCNQCLDHLDQCQSGTVLVWSWFTFTKQKKPTPVQTSFAQRIANGRARRTQQNRNLMLRVARRMKLLDPPYVLCGSVQTVSVA
jgi:hypothetical protein